MNFKFDNKKWISLGRWTQDPLSGCFWCHWNEAQSVKEIMKKDESLDYILFLDGYTLVSERCRDYLEGYIEKICDSNEVEKFRELYNKISLNCEEKHLQILENKNVELSNYATDLFRTFSEVIGVWSLAVLMGEILQNYIIKNNLAASEEDLFEKVAPYTRKTWLENQSAEIKEFIGIIKQRDSQVSPKLISDSFFEKHQDVSQKIDEHVSRYAWYGTHHWEGEGYTREKCIAQIKDEFENDFGNYLEVDKKDDNQVLSLMADFIYWRTHCAEASCKVVYDSRDILIKCAKQLGINYNQLLLFSSQEIISKLSKKEKGNLTPEIEERKNGYGCYIDSNNKEVLLIGDELKKALELVINEVDEKITEIKGIVACKGEKIRGRVKVLISPEDFLDFKKGDILVASETAPDFVPCMRLSSAIITETGGITSHAAIVSREMGKPCIIGTKIATRVLKDGDLVEVDANKGVVKILKKK